MVLSLKDTILLSISKNCHLLFRDVVLRDQLFPLSISEDLLNCLDIGNIGIEEKYLQFFVKDKCSLKIVILHCYKMVNISSMSFLRGHQLKILYIEGLRNYDVKDWLKFVEPHYLQELSIVECSFNKLGQKKGTMKHPLTTSKGLVVKMKNYNSDCFINILKSFKNLTKLNVSSTDFTTNYLLLVCNEFSKLQSLNISRTYIDDLSPLKKLEELTFLDCSWIFSGSCYDSFFNLHKLQNLKYLDISKLFTVSTTLNANLFIQKANWKNLYYLNISGDWKISNQTIKL